MGYGTNDPDEIRGYFRSLPLPQRMREAARVLNEANGRHFGKFVNDDCAWSVAGLTEVADRFETEDDAAAELFPIITTGNELDELPDETVISDEDGCTYKRFRDHWYGIGSNLACDESIELPARVIARPERSEP